MSPTGAPEEAKDIKGVSVFSKVKKKLTTPKAKFQLDDAVQKSSARLPYTGAYLISESRYDATQECWMYKVRNDQVEDPGTSDTGWLSEYALKKP